MLLLRAATRTHGLPGFTAGSRLVQQLLDRYWSDIHPALDADDDNDPTMRLNALAAFADETTLLRDLYGAIVGNAPGVGPIRVRDIAVARNVLAASADSLAPATVQGGLEHLQAERPDTADKLRAITPVIAALDETIGSRANLPAAIDFAKLRTIGHALSQAAAGIAGAPPEDAPDQDTGQGVHTEGDQAAAAQRTRASAGEVHSRQDALTALDKVIRYLQQAEPGNPAPLLIERAKRLIGVSFLEIMADLAPNALDTIEVVTGRRPESES